MKINILKVFQTIYFGALILFVSACGYNQSNARTQINDEVNSLKSIADKRQFLEFIFEQDQNVRNSEESARLVTEYGNSSDEHRAYIERQWQQDETNLIKVESYLNKYGNPSKIELGEYAAMAPWIVIHHNMDIAIRNRNFQHLYKAYLEDNIDDNASAMYLGRSHRITFNEDFYIESPFKAEDELNGLIAKLGFEEEKELVLNQMNN